MIVFFREAFKSGVMIIKDRDEDGKVFKVMLTPAENGQEIQFQDEAFVLAQYPEWAMTKIEHKKKKSDNKKAKQDRKMVRS